MPLPAWTPKARKEYVYRQGRDRKKYGRINLLITQGKSVFIACCAKGIAVTLVVQPGFPASAGNDVVPLQ